MKDKTILCDNCLGLLDISKETEDYFEFGEDETCGVVECPKCKIKNAIYYSLTPHFSAREADEDDLKDFPIE